MIKEQTNPLLMGGFNNLSFYQAPNFLQNNSSDGINAINTGAVRNFDGSGKGPKDQQMPLELVGKMNKPSSQEDVVQQPTTASSSIPDTIVPHHHFPYK
jgi:hypothetical protein